MGLIDAQVPRFQADGFLILPGPSAAVDVDALRVELPGVFAEDTETNIREMASDEVRTAMGPPPAQPAVRARLCRHRRFVLPARQLLGTDQLDIQQAKVNAKVAFTGEAWQWPYDFATHHADGAVQLSQNRPVGAARRGHHRVLE